MKLKSETHKLSLKNLIPVLCKKRRNMKYIYMIYSLSKKYKNFNLIKFIFVFKHFFYYFLKSCQKL